MKTRKTRNLDLERERTSKLIGLVLNNLKKAPQNLENLPSINMLYSLMSTQVALQEGTLTNGNLARLIKLRGKQNPFYSNKGLIFSENFYLNPEDLYEYSDEAGKLYFKLKPETKGYRIEKQLSIFTPNTVRANLPEVETKGAYIYFGGELAKGPRPTTKKAYEPDTTEY